MSFLKSKQFWFTIAHLGVAGASIAGAILFPPAAPIIIGSQAMINGLIPSPLQPPKQFDIETGGFQSVGVPMTKADAQATAAALNKK